MFVTCKICQKEFNKSPSEIKKTKNNFCSRSCSAKFTNKTPKRKKTLHKCYSCDEMITVRNKYCSQCLFNLRNEDITLINASSRYDKHHRTSAFGLVRTRAKAIAKKLGWNNCEVCGYDKHIEIAHIKPISSFPDDAMLSTINDPSNLRPLCPNCHWEFDNLK